MINSEDKLEKLETVINEVVVKDMAEIKRQLLIMFAKYDRLCDPDEGTIVKQGKKIEKHDAYLTILASMLLFDLGGIIYAVIKITAGH